MFMRVKPSSVCSSIHFPRERSSIQWPVTAKYPSVLDACHASHVKLIFPEMYRLYTINVKGFTEYR